MKTHQAAISQTPALRRPPRLPTVARSHPTTPPAFTQKSPQPPTLSVKKGQRSANVPTSATQYHPNRTYTRGRDMSGSLQGAVGIGGMLAMSVGAASPRHYYYHADGNGNNTAMINASQAIAAKYLYDAFGNLLSQSGPMAAINHYRFSSKEFMLNSGLVYYLYQFYEPNLQRWMNRDPIGERGGINLYVFAANKPTFCIDICGLCPPDCNEEKNAVKDAQNKVNADKTTLTKDQRHVERDLAIDAGSILVVACGVAVAKGPAAVPGAIAAAVGAIIAAAALDQTYEDEQDLENSIQQYKDDQDALSKAKKALSKCQKDAEKQKKDKDWVDFKNQTAQYNEGN